MRKSRARGRRTAVLLVAAAAFSYGLGSALPGVLAQGDRGDKGKDSQSWTSSIFSSSSSPPPPPASSSWMFWKQPEAPKGVVERIRGAIGV